MQIELKIPKQPQEFTVSSIVRMVSKISHIPIYQLKSEAQHKSVTCARYICFYFIREHVKSSDYRDDCT
jgi:chromosomal replication initiation ATPase DnaA